MSDLFEEALSQIQSRYANNPLYIKNHTIKDGLKKYVSYCISGSAIDDMEINRRYSDFFALREKLCKRWPGIYIPNIPKKKTVGNLEISTILSRMRLLNLFTERFAKFDYLLSSEEFKLFRSDKPDFIKQLDKLPPVNYEDMLEKYKLSFSNFKFLDAYDENLGRERVLDFLNTLKKAHSNIKHFKDMIYITLDCKNKELEHYISFLSSFDDYEKYGLLEFADNNEDKLVMFNPSNVELLDSINKAKEKLRNAFEDISEWLRGEEIDVDAMIEAINGFQGLNDAKKKLDEKYVALDKEIKEFQFGDKKTLKGIFTRKNKDERLEEMQKDKQNAKEQSDLLKSILKYVTFH